MARTEHVTDVLGDDVTACGVTVVMVANSDGEERLFTDDGNNEPVHTSESGEHYDCEDCITATTK